MVERAFLTAVLLVGCGGSDRDPDDAAPLPDAIAAVDAVPPIDAPACAAEISCPPPDSGNVSICGRLFDLETGEPIAEVGAVGTACNPTSPTSDGPCSIGLQFYDFLEFAANPTGTAPLSADEITIDDCGRFRAANLTRPFNGFVSVTTDDAPAGAGARYTPTTRPFPLEMGETRTLVRAPVTRQETEVSTYYAATGAALFVFEYQGAPAAGVTITAGGTTWPDDDSYFCDTDPGTLSDLCGGTATGINGAGLLTNSSLGQHSGTGGVPPGCSWHSELSMAIPTVILYDTRPAHVTGDPDTPCP